MLVPEIMVGFITERHLQEADEAFPGIACFFEACPCKPRTFLELVALFEHWCSQAPVQAGEPAQRAA